jgi:hypothetical protein
VALFGNGDLAMQKECVACAEDIKLDAKLCKHCGTRQDEAEFIDSPKPAKNSGDKTAPKQTKGTYCPECRQIDSVARVSSIVDRGRQNSSSIGFSTQTGSGQSPYTNLAVGSSSSHLADRLTIYVPQAEFQYKFVDFLMGCFFAGVGFFGFVFKQGAPVDSGPLNPIFASIATLAIGPIIGIATAVARKNNNANNLVGLQLLMESAHEKLRNSYYCSRDDLVFNKLHSASPEDFIDYLIDMEEES